MMVGRKNKRCTPGKLRCLCQGHQAMMQLQCYTFQWCEGLTQQLVADAGSIGDDRHKLDVPVRQLGKIKEELRGTDTHILSLQPNAPVQGIVPPVDQHAMQQTTMAGADSPQLLQASSLETLQSSS